MSISVKNILLSIDGTNSNKFKMQLDGALYHFDNFRMRQRLMQPCELAFTMFKDPIEDISEPQFSICSYLIGKEIRLTLQTEEMETEITNNKDEGKTSEIEFEGFITSTRGTRIESKQAIMVTAYSKDVVLEDHPHCQIFNEEKLADIIKTIYSVAKLDDKEIQPEMEDEIFYTAQYNETNYNFLRRMARRHSEWFFNNGTLLHFGKIENSENIQLVYPSRDIPYYGVRLQTFHPNFIQVGICYNEDGNNLEYAQNTKEEIGNTLSDAAFKASAENYPHETIQTMPAAYLESDKESENSSLDKPTFYEDPKSEKLCQRANQLIYEGKTYCSRLEIGVHLTIKDNYISNNEANNKSEVQQDEIIITEVVHVFKANEQYENSFRGITAAYPHPPYKKGDIHPRCDHPIKAYVVDNEDPKHWGRVRLQFPWQSKQYAEGDKNGQTPWVHVLQPYTGMNAGQGAHLIPEIWSQALVNFEEGDFERPYVCGTHYSSGYQDDEKWYEEHNHIKAIRTASGHTIEVHDKDEDKGGFIKIYDHQSNHYVITLDTDKKLIRLESAGNIELSAKKDIVMNAGNNMTINVGKPKDGYNLDEGDSGSFALNVENYYYNYVGFEQRVKAEFLSMLTTKRRRVKAPTYILNSEEYNVEVHSETSETPGSFITATDSELNLRSDGNVNVRSRNDLTLYGGTNVNISANFEAKLTSSESVSISGTSSVIVKGLQIELN